MKRKIDELNRITIPAEYLKELGIKKNQELEIEKISNKIMITSPKIMRAKEEVEKMYEDIHKLTNKTEYDKGFEEALKFVLNK